MTFLPIERGNGDYVLKMEYIFMDCIFVTLAVVLFGIQEFLTATDSLNFMQIGVLTISRAYTKLPFLVVLIRFMIKSKKLKAGSV